MEDRREAAHDSWKVFSVRCHYRWMQKCPVGSTFLVFPICLSLLLVGSGSRLTPHAWLMTCGGWIPPRGNIPKDLCTSFPFVIPLWQHGVLGSLTLAESSGSLTCTGFSPFLSFSVILPPTFYFSGFFYLM